MHIFVAAFANTVCNVDFFNELFTGRMKYVCQSTELCILRHFLKQSHGKCYHFLERKHPLKCLFTQIY